MVNKLFCKLTNWNIYNKELIMLIYTFSLTYSISLASMHESHAIVSHSRDFQIFQAYTNSAAIFQAVSSVTTFNLFTKGREWEIKFTVSGAAKSINFAACSSCPHKKHKLSLKWDKLKFGALFPDVYGLAASFISEHFTRGFSDKTSLLIWFSLM